MDDIAAVYTSNTFAFPDSSPQSLRTATPSQKHFDILDEMNSDTIFDDYEPSPHILNDSEEDYVTEDDLLLPDPAPSGRSSISSFPASVVHHDVVPSHTFDGLITPSRSRAGTPTSYQQNYKPLSPVSTREHLAGFRNPSSVRALQMRDEFSDTEDLTPNHRRRGSRMSYVSYRSGSTHSTPGKRMSRSLTGSPVKNTSKLRKEFPLVLLHCSLIPSIISPKAGLVNEELLEAIIPEPYKKRWKLLQEKVMRNHEVRERGVLIPHPKDDYDMLEERLLESLELERPVISNGHYVGRSDSRASATDSGFGSEENSSRGDATDEEEEGKCADCGGRMCGEKRWEVKVYAANGLMKAGAWSAAWSEMEKVDVQVSVTLPEDIRQEVEARLDAVIAQEQEFQQENIQPKEVITNDDRTREIYGEKTQPRRQEDIDGFGDEIAQAIGQEPHTPPKLERTESISSKCASPENVDLQDAFKKYIQLMLQDRRNIAIIFLSLMLLFYGVCGFKASGNAAVPETINESVTETLHETKIEYLTTTLFSTSTTTALETSTIVKTTQLSIAPTMSTPDTATVQSTSYVEPIATPMVSIGSEPVPPMSPAEEFNPPTTDESQPLVVDDLQPLLNSTELNKSHATAVAGNADVQPADTMVADKDVPEVPVQSDEIKNDEL